ncbi:MAG: type IV pilus biogenesis/stability protein PilW [Alteromonadaceae bacterium]|nr:MAG: type IV pilus biogenesis/stability protein PilW [Alteromonadaceae bacterium]
MAGLFQYSGRTKSCWHVCLSFALLVFLTACVSSGGKKTSTFNRQKAVEANVKLGMAYLQKGQRDDAVRAFSKALELDPNAAEANQGMALVHQVSGEFKAAESRFKRALKGRSAFSMSGIEFSYGRFLLERNRCPEALEYFERVRKDFKYQRRHEALFNIGRCAGRAGDTERALASYQYALSLNNNYAPASLELAHMLFDRENYAGAKNNLDSYSRNSRQSARSLLLGIRIERIFGNKDKEASYVLALKNLHPYSKEYLEYQNLVKKRAQ